MDDARKAIITRLEEAQATRNAFSKQIGQAKAQKDEAKASELMAAGRAPQGRHPAGRGRAPQRRRGAAQRAAQSCRTCPRTMCPPASDEADNVEYFGPNGNAATAAKARPPKPSFSFKPKEHFETGEALGMMDFEVAAKISGAASRC